MVTFKEVTFNNVTDNHTIEAEFEESTTPTGGSSIRMFVKLGGTWKPLFTSN